MHTLESDSSSWMGEKRERELENWVKERKRERGGATLERCGSRQQLTINTTIHTTSLYLWLSLLSLSFPLSPFLASSIALLFRRLDRSWVSAWASVFIYMFCLPCRRRSVPRRWVPVHSHLSFSLFLLLLFCFLFLVPTNSCVYGGSSVQTWNKSRGLLFESLL